MKLHQQPYHEGVICNLSKAWMQNFTFTDTDLRFLILGSLPHCLSVTLLGTAFASRLCWSRKFAIKTPFHPSSCPTSKSSLFPYWLWSCVVTVLILLTKYCCPCDDTLLNYFLQHRGITSACWTCSTIGQSISLAATIRPPFYTPSLPLSPLRDLLGNLSLPLIITKLLLFQSRPRAYSSSCLA